MRERFEGNYFKVGDGVVRIKEIHDHTFYSDYSVWVEVDDFCGDFYGSFPEKVWLNNENLLFHASNMFIESLDQVDEEYFQKRLIEEINKSIAQVDSGNDCPTLYWKKTPVRLEMLRKRYNHG